MAIAGRVAAFFRNDTVTGSVAFTSEAMTNSGDQKDYYITNTAKRYWDDLLVPTVQTSTDGGTVWSAVSATLYTVEYIGGHIVFAVARNPAHLFRVSGKSFSLLQVGGGFGWAADLKLDTEEVTTFESGGFKEYKPILKDWTGSLDAYWINGNLQNLLGAMIIAVLYVENTLSGGRSSRYEGKCILDNVSTDSAVDKVVDQSINLQGQGPLYYRETT